MSRTRWLRRIALAILLVANFTLAGGETTWAEVFTLKNGFQLQGSPGSISSLGADPRQFEGAAGELETKLIYLLDDGLRRTFFSTYQHQSHAPDPPSSVERIVIDQPVAMSSRKVAMLGRFTATPFNQWGRRTVTLNTERGKLEILQGITEITPTYTRLESLVSGSHTQTWDMRVATSSLPLDLLSKVVRNNIDAGNADERRRLVRLLIQAERYNDALLELMEVKKDFPDVSNIDSQISRLHQQLAQQLLSEIEARREAGQHQRVVSALSSFPTKGVAGETLLRAHEILSDYEKADRQRLTVLELLSAQLAEIANPDTKAECEPVLQEIRNELNVNTMDRMADYLRLVDDKDLRAEQKLALAISGWLLGANAARENLAEALSLYQVRSLVRDYLRSSLQHDRGAILDSLASLEGSTPADVSKLIRSMKPPLDVPEMVEGYTGLFRLTAEGLAEKEDFTYFIQLPDEYDPYRRYPCLVTLHGIGAAPLTQIDWWAGPYDTENKTRRGQASRHGYIVLAPQWTSPDQSSYKYSLEEHAAVLFSLRDACRRFSIDTDRVFLTGHAGGGDAAWDIGLAHPDLWAGLIPIVAGSDKFTIRYADNARGVPLVSRGLPMYFVTGEYDAERLARNLPDFNRYLTRNGFDTVVVEYRGRGYEDYYDEIHRIFQWMSLARREFFPRDFSCASLRPWDNFFWWVELDEFPPATMVNPLNFQPKANPAETHARVLENNGVSVRTGAKKATVYLSPEMVNFDQPVSVAVRGRGSERDVRPDLSVLLEDVRRRGDRQHPFWAKVEF